MCVCAPKSEKRRRERKKRETRPACSLLLPRVVARSFVQTVNQSVRQASIARFTRESNRVEISNPQMQLERGAAHSSVRVVVRLLRIIRNTTTTTTTTKTDVDTLLFKTHIYNLVHCKLLVDSERKRPYSHIYIYAYSHSFLILCLDFCSCCVYVCFRCASAFLASPRVAAQNRISNDKTQKQNKCIFQFAITIVVVTKKSSEQQQLGKIGLL